MREHVGGGDYCARVRAEAGKLHVGAELQLVDEPSQLVLERPLRPPPGLLLLSDEQKLSRREPRHHLSEGLHEEVLTLPLRELCDADDERDVVTDPELAANRPAVDGLRIPARGLGPVHDLDDSIGRDMAALDDQAPRPIGHGCDQIGVPQRGLGDGRHPIAVLGVEAAHPFDPAHPREQEAVQLVASGVVSVHDTNPVTTQVADRADEVSDGRDEL